MVGWPRFGVELIFYLAISGLVSVVMLAVAIDGLQRGWLRIDVGVYGELARLRDRINDLEAVLEAVREERNGLMGELVNANRMISTLEGRIEEMERTLREHQRIRILAIWPTINGANQKGERDAIYNAGFDYQALWAVHATKAHILRELRKDGYSILELGAHGLEDGTIHLYDGPVLPGWWQRALTGRQMRVAVLLACYSDALADAMLRAGVQFVVATVGAIQDEAAVAFAKAFYAGYADGLDVESAVNDARLVLPLDQAEMIVLRKAGELR